MRATVVTPESLPTGISYLPGFVEAERATRWFESLRQDIAWQSEEIGLFGRRHVVPRLVSWAGDEQTSYRYSGCDHHGDGWSPLLAEIRETVSAALVRMPDFVLLNLYRSGRDGMGWHRDDEVMTSDLLGSLSLGAQRRFLVRHPDVEGSIPLVLEHGSLLIFDRSFPHSLPKTTRKVGERINLSFRSVS